MESFDSRDLLCSYGNSLRPTVAKSYSFGGYTATTTSDAEVVGVQCDTVANGTPAVYQQSHLLSQAQNQNYGSRFLSKQVRSREVRRLQYNIIPMLDDFSRVVMGNL